MNKERDKKINLKSLPFFACIFLVFYFAAKEDRVYKEWEKTNKELFTSYFDLKERSKTIMQPGEKVLIEISQLKNWKNPFNNRFLGNMRGSLYFRLNPRLKEYSSRLYLGDLDLQVENLSESRIFEPHEDISQAEIQKVKINDYKRLKTFMIENGIGYSISHCENLWQKKRELERAGFNINHYNKQFILFSVRKEKS